jgi:hypothetical protein
MAFVPSDPLLDTVTENFAFSHVIAYNGVDSTGATVSYDVTLKANEANPSTIVINANAISGYYYGQFPADIQYLAKDGSYLNVGTFDQIDTTKLREVIYYKASMVTSKTYNYTATATYTDPSTLITDTQTQVYQIVLMNDWSSGITSLKSYVGMTV